MLETADPAPACDGPWTPRLAWLGLGLSAAAALLIWELRRAAGAGGGPALPLAAGLAFGCAAVGEAIVRHWRGHTAEARRLGFPLATVLLPRPRLLLTGRAAAPQRERWRTEATLVRIAGAWANERLHAHRLKIGNEWIFPLILSSTLIFTLPLGTLPPRVVAVLQAVNFLVAAAALCVFGVFHANKLIAQTAREELWGRPKFYPKEFRSWPFWAHRYQRSLYDQRRYARDHRLILRAAGLRGSKAVVELGSGGSVVFEHLPRPRTRGWVQVDLDLAALIAAKSRGGGGRPVCADGNRLPFADSSVDLVTALGFFDSLIPEQTETILEEAKRILKTGGTLVHFQDYEDWPGQDLAGEFNLVLRAAGREERVVFDPRAKRLKYPEFDEPRRAAALDALRRSIRTLASFRRGHSAVLERLLASAKAPGEKHGRPLEAFKLVFTEALERHGFRVVSGGEELRKHLYRTSYLIARKKS